MGLPRVLTLVLLAGGALAGEEVWSWHSVDYTFLKTKRVDWALHTRLRTREGELQQSRTGTIVRVAANARVSVIGGYYYGRQEDTRAEWQDSHRMFGGAEARLYRKGVVTVAGRGLAERFVTEGRPSTWRFRQRVRLTTEQRVGPYVSGEWFWDPQGYLATRYQGGVRWRGAGWMTVEAGYMYDARSAQLGVPRHGMVTHVYFEPWRAGRRNQR
jgi:hypothetical protein